MILKGIHIELLAPTMGILAANIHVDFSGMGSVLASRGAGYLVANILGAILQNVVKKILKFFLFVHLFYLLLVRFCYI